MKRKRILAAIAALVLILLMLPRRTAAAKAPGETRAF